MTEREKLNKALMTIANAKSVLKKAQSRTDIPDQDASISIAWEAIDRALKALSGSTKY